MSAICARDFDFLCVGFRVLDIAEEAHGETQITSMYGWSDHTLPVTGLLAGSGGPSAIIVSCSLDHTCKVFSFSPSKLICRYHLNKIELE